MNIVKMEKVSPEDIKKASELKPSDILHFSEVSSEQARQAKEVYMMINPGPLKPQDNRVWLVNVTTGDVRSCDADRPVVRVVANLTVSE